MLMRQKRETRVCLLGEDFFKLNSTFKKLLMSCASFYCMAAKWSEEGREGRGMTSVCPACDGDICLKIRIKPLKIYLGVEFIKTNNHIRAIVISMLPKRC